MTKFESSYELQKSGYFTRNPLYEMNEIFPNLNKERRSMNLVRQLILRKQKRNLLLDKMSIKISFLSLNAKQICY